MTTPANTIDRTLSVIVPFATIAMIAVNYLAVAGHINGVTPDVISDKYPTVLTPAGYAFTIWSAIYIGLIAFSIFQLLPSKRTEFGGVRILYIVGCLLNIAWIYAWHYEAIGNSVAVIAIMLMMATIVMARASRSAVRGSALFARAPLGLYAGWLTLAAISCLAADLRSNAVGWSDTAWNYFGVAMLVLACLAAVGVRVRLRNFLYPLAIAWGATGIAVKQSGNTAIVFTAAFVTIICLVLSISFVMDLPRTADE